MEIDNYTASDVASVLSEWGLHSEAGNTDILIKSHSGGTLATFWITDYAGDSAGAAGAAARILRNYARDRVLEATVS